MVAFKNEKFNLIVISLLCLILLSSPLIKRTIENTGIIRGEDVYYDLEKTINTRDLVRNYFINGERFSLKQPDSIVGRFFYITPFNMILGVISLLINPVTLFKVLPLLAGIISLFLFYYLLKRLNFKKENINLAIFILILSPIFLYTFNVVTAATIGIPLFLIYLIAAHKKRFIISLSLLIIISLLSFTSSIIALLSFLYLIPLILEQKKMPEETDEKKKKDNKRRVKNKKHTLKEYFDRTTLFILTGSAILISLIVVNSKIYYFEFLKRGTLLELISEIGSLKGISLVVLLMGFWGCDLIKKKTLLKWLPYLFLLPLFYLKVLIIPYLMLALALPASYELTWLIKRKWFLPLLKNISIFLIFIEILIVGVSSDFRISSLEPNNPELNVFSSLNSQVEGLVWTSPKYGFWVNYFSGKQVFADKYSSKDIIKLNNDNMLSKNLNKVLDFINKTGIRYILITPEMKRNVWKDEDDGLLFLLKNSNAFNNIYKKDFEVWEVNQTRVNEILSKKNRI